MTQIITSRPPNYEDILAVFPGASGQGVIFAYAPDIYAPGGQVPLPIVAHEQVHIDRQKDIGVAKWWERYLIDGNFRYEEELLAHRAEYQYLIEVEPSRQGRRQALRHIAKKLCAPLYGKMVSLEVAMRDLKQ